MADSIASQLIGGVQAGIEHTASNIQTGSQLAQTVENISAQRQKLEQDRQTLEMQKIEKVASLYETAGKLPPKAQNFIYQKVIPNTAKGLGVDKYFPESTQTLLSSDSNAVPYFMAHLREHPEDMSAILTDMTDPTGEALAKHFPDIQKFGAAQAINQELHDSMKDLTEAHKFGTSEEGKSYRTKLTADSAMGKQIQGQQAAPDVEYKKKISDIAANYNANGGTAGVQKNVAALDNAIEQLKAGKVNFGTVGKNLPYGSSMDVLARTDPKAKALIDQVQGSVNMRAALADPNPTEKQISMILNRTIDPRLNNDENIKKLEAMKNELQSATSSREDEFRQAGLLPKRAKSGSGKSSGGAAPKLPLTPDQVQQFHAVPDTLKGKVLLGLAAKYNMTMDQVKQALGVK